ncbi:MAG: DUF4215 domain-containing protein [Sandaracinaceae bacterium]|nr:DUF4215 domain-containing protein [Sandaracinaceae bacterium]
MGEACDDNNIVPEDGCDSTCQIEAGWSCFEPPSSASQCTNTCGDGVVDYPAEQCDDGEANNDTTPNACRAVCKSAACGDGAVQTQGKTATTARATRPPPPTRVAPRASSPSAATASWTMARCAIPGWGTR